MAVDLCIMPLSRYISKDYITQIMKECWDNGYEYTIIKPDGEIKISPNTPIGGINAHVERQKWESLIIELMKKLPIDTNDILWNETSNLYDVYRLDTESWQSMLNDCTQFEQEQSINTMLTCFNLFLPVDFPDLFTIFNERFSVCSIKGILYELDIIPWSSGSTDAVDTYIEACDYADKHNLPIIVDA